MTDFPIYRGNAVVARGAGYFEVPLFSHVIDGLWQGCSPAEFPDAILPGDPRYALSEDAPTCKWLWLDWEQGVYAKPRFDAILNLYQWGEYVVPVGVEQLTVEMYDSLDLISDQVDELADWVIERLDQDKKVLVHCQAGLNRSSLVVARVLMKNYKMKSWEAIKLIRNQRSQMCLCNESFVKHLFEIDRKENVKQELRSVATNE